MRTCLRMLALVLVVSAGVSAQQTTSLDRKLTDILNRMECKDAAKRQAAFDDLFNFWPEGIDAGLAQHPDEAERVKLALIRLLRTENSALQAARPGSKSEDYGEYVFSLTQTVSAMKDDRAIPVLVEATPRSGVDLVQFGDKALEPVLGQLKNSDALVRARALEIGLRILQSKSDPAPRARARALVLSSLNDQSMVVRSAAIRAIDCLDDRQEYVPTLEKMAKTEPEKLPGKALDGGDSQEFYPVRYDARRVLRDIQNNKTCQH